MRVLFLFLDGIGLGADDPEINPFARTEMPCSERLLGGRKLLLGSAPIEAERASLLALDASLGVEGMPQSATGQATLVTGRNVPKAIGRHYGPKPNRLVAAQLQDGNLFKAVREAGLQAAFLNAYPPRYFEAIETGRRLYSAIPLAVTSAGLRLRTERDLRGRRALSADFTGQGWRDQLGYAHTPLLSPHDAGRRLARLAARTHLAFFEYWLSDYAGHRQDMQAACRLLETLDAVLEGLLADWDDREGLVLLTSDHGNMEDLSTRRHTTNPVPALLIGSREVREQFRSGLSDLSDVAPAIRRLLGIKEPAA